MKPDDDRQVPDRPSTSGVHRAQPGPPRLPAPSPRVLVLERDEGLLKTLSRYLPGPYRHLVVSSLSEAFSVMATASAPYGGLITDAHPEDGDVFEWLADSRRGGWTGQVLITSADPSKDLPHRAARQGADFILKDGDHARVAARFRRFLHWVSINRMVDVLLRNHGQAHGLTAAEQDVLDHAPWIRASLIYEALPKGKAGTVRGHISAILRKTGEYDLDGVVSSALAYGYIGNIA